jgi:aspartate aminotransferase
VVVNGVSKSYAMTGWRIGFLAGPREIVDAIANLKSHVTSNAAAPSQHAALAALRSGPGWTQQMAVAFRRRLDATAAALNAMPDVSLAVPVGAFYVFPRMDRFYGGRIAGSSDFCDALLEEVRVAAVPGAAFGEDRCVRFSIAAADDRLAEGMQRLAGFLDGLRAEQSGSASPAGAGATPRATDSSTPSSTAPTAPTGASGGPAR